MSYVGAVLGVVQSGSPLCISKEHVQVLQVSQHVLISWAAVQVCTPGSGSRHAEEAVAGVRGGILLL